MDKRIVILQRGWVMVGDFHQDGEKCWLTNGAVVRFWGTTEGLGELAIKGPLKDTKLDKIPETHFHELTIIASVKCDEKAWE
jgi:hypothetical protein